MFSFVGILLHGVFQPFQTPGAEEHHDNHNYNGHRENGQQGGQKFQQLPGRFHCIRFGKFSGAEKIIKKSRCQKNQHCINRFCHSLLRDPAVQPWALHLGILRSKAERVPEYRCLTSGRGYTAYVVWGSNVPRFLAAQVRALHTATIGDLLHRKPPFASQ